MKIKLFLISCIILLISLFGASRTTAQSPILDIGQQDPLLSACNFITDLANDEGLIFYYCRRESIQLIDDKAFMLLKVKTNSGIAKVEIRLRKSIWNVEKFLVKY